MNGDKKAAAIKYLKGDKAPLAREKQIPFVEDPVLLDQLLILEPGAYLPPELFEVAARILSFVYAQDNSTDS
jgi:type III secretion system FlhB-like substrate exporter